MRIRLTALLGLCLPFTTLAQSYPGFRTGSYTGVYSSFFNPAAVAQNNFKWDISLAGVHAELGNNNKPFTYKDLKTTLDGNTDMGRLGNTYEKISAFAGADVAGPSFMISKKKWGIALTSRSRAMVNLTDLDGNLLNSINNRSFRGTPYILKSEKNQKITANAWTEYGLSYGVVLHENEKSILKFGITGNYLAGSVNTWLEVKDLKGIIDRNITAGYFLTDASAGISTGYSGFDVSNFQLKDLSKKKGTGYAGSVGFIYESKNTNDTSKKPTNSPYRLKLGIALTDIGVIKYSAADFADYTLLVSSTQQWYPLGIDGKSINEIKQYFDSSPYFTNTSTGNRLSYKVKMPMALHVNADIAMSKNFYTDLSAHINLNKPEDRYSSFYYTAFSVTPRLETPRFGMYIPFTYSTLSNFNAGLSFRLGPVFFGSGSLFTVLMNNSRQADVHAGIRFGGLAKKPKKKARKKEETVPVPEQPEPVAETDTDQDGVPDKEDKCPDVPGLPRYNGCPVPDTDGDGINDEADQCPDMPGTEKYKGCPVPDSDNDGVNDDDDKCPKIPGKPENDGCPEVKKEITQKVNYAARRIYFKSSSFDLLPVSYKGLNDVASILKNNPDLKLRVEGHTDSTGIPENNKILSQLRALAVKQYLVKKGIDPDRITIFGYGQERPVATNETREGKAKNRRVEMKIGY